MDDELAWSSCCCAVAKIGERLLGVAVVTLLWLNRVAILEHVIEFLAGHRPSQVRFFFFG